MQFPGKSDDILINMPVLDGVFKTKIEKHINDLVKCNESNDKNKRQTVLIKFMQFISSCPINNFEDFLWHWNITCRFLLLNDLESEATMDKFEFIEHTFQNNIQQGYKCPIKIHFIAKNLYEVLDEDTNLFHVVSSFINFNELTRNVGMALIWAGIFRLMNNEFKFFKIHSLGVLEKILETYTPPIAISNKQTLLKFLYYISLLQNTVMLRKESIYYSNVPFPSENSSFLISWLNQVKDLVEKDIMGEQEETEGLDILELIVLDILNLFVYNEQ